MPSLPPKAASQLPASELPVSELPPSEPPASRLRVLIVAHGQPSDPGPAAAALDHLAAQVAAMLPAGAAVVAATLAEPGAVGRAAGQLAAGDGAADLLVYPMFMAPGWFTQVALPERLKAEGAGPVHQLAPFGADPALGDLAARLLSDELAARGWAAADTRLLLAAHGSFKSAAPAAVARAFAAGLAARLGLAGAEAAFIDQSPQIAEARGFPIRSLCLPFFAASGGHVEQDLPQALADAGFPGPCLPPLGLSPEVPGLISASLLRAAG